MAENIKLNLSKLSDDQLKVAVKIIEAANTVGVDPNYALSMGYIESRFNPKVPNSSAGAIGVMQLLPNTAKDMKVDPANLDENILGGVKYMKYLLEHPNVSGDPNLMIAAYHEGPNSEFFKTGDKSKISDPGVMYVHAVNQLMQGKMPGEQAEGAAPVGEMPPPPPPADDVYSLETAKPSPEQMAAEQERGFSPLSMMGGAIPGAGVGTAAGAYQTRPVQGVLSALSNLGGPSGPVSAGPTTAGPTSAGLPPAQGPATRTPVGGRGTFNYAKQFGMTDFDAARAADMSKAPGGAWDVARQVAEAERKIGPGYRMVPERADLMLPDSAGGGPRGSRRVPIPEVQQPRTPLAQRVSGTMARHPMITGPLAGMSMGAQAAEAAERYRAGDVPGAAVMGTGALGSAAAMLPKLLPKASPVGLAASIAAPVITGIMDYTRNRQVTPSSISADLMKDLKDWEMRYKANIQKGKGGTEGFSLPMMQ